MSKAKRIVQYRNHAVAVRVIAECFGEPTRKTLLAVAETYDRLAKEAAAET